MCTVRVVIVSNSMGVINDRRLDLLSYTGTWPAAGSGISSFLFVGDKASYCELMTQIQRKEIDSLASGI